MKQLHRTRAFTLVELLVVIGIIALLISILLPSLNRARETANRVKCSANLKSIGQAILLYAGENRQIYPRTLYKGDITTVPFATWGTGASGTNPFNASLAAGSQRPYENDVSAALYLLLSTQDISPEVFTCPSANFEKWDYEGGGNTVANWCNWNGTQGITKYLAYSYQNPYGDSSSVTSGFKLNTSLSAEYAVAADINPGSAVAIGGVGEGSPADNAAAVNSDSKGGALKMGNSNNHGKDGQNILWGDGHVDFQLTPFAGIGGDNIYTRKDGQATDNKRGSDLTAAFGSPYNKDDNVLLPTD